MSVATVYTKPGCPSCDETKALMSELGLEYKEVDISVDRNALTRLRSMGYRGAPVVETEETNWSGFNESAIRDLATGVSAWDF